MNKKAVAFGLAGALMIASTPAANAQTIAIPGIGAIPVEVAVGVAGTAALGSLGLAALAGGTGSGNLGTPTPPGNPNPEPQGKFAEWSLQIERMSNGEFDVCTAEFDVVGRLDDSGISWFGYWDVQETTGTGLAGNINRWSNGTHVVLASWTRNSEGEIIASDPGEKFLGRELTFDIAHVGSGESRTELGQVTVTVPSECSPLPVSPSTVAVIDSGRLVAGS